MLSCTVMFNSLRPQGLQPARLFCLWDFPGKNTGVRCHFLLQFISQRAYKQKKPNRFEHGDDYFLTLLTQFIDMNNTMCVCVMM